MVLTELGGLTVFRQIPYEYRWGVLGSAYTVNGGLLRNEAGKIFAHLVFGGPTTPLASLAPGANI